MAFFAEARDFTISGGTFTNHAHRPKGEKGAYSFVLRTRRLNHDTTYLI